MPKARREALPGAETGPAVTTTSTEGPTAEGEAAATLIMAVYVDPAVWPFGRMMMCHMIADTRAELVDMARQIGVRVKWIQHAGDHRREHFDICKSKRAMAVKLGAVEIDMQDYPTRLDDPRRTRESYFAPPPERGRGVREFERR